MIVAVYSIGIWLMILSAVVLVGHLAGLVIQIAQDLLHARRAAREAASVDPPRARIARSRLVDRISARMAGLHRKIGERKHGPLGVFWWMKVFLYTVGPAVWVTLVWFIATHRYGSLIAIAYLIFLVAIILRSAYP